jgi:choline dehydrogenase-like flavoprotein
VVLVHDETSGRVVLGPGGIPRAHYWPEKRDLEEIKRGIRALAEIYLAAGAQKIRLPFQDSPLIENQGQLEQAMARAQYVPHRLLLNSVHPQGSCPMGNRKDQSAVNPEGEVWTEPGLYLGDTSLFPTSVGVPPQVTAMALGSFVADCILAEHF